MIRLIPFVVCILLLLAKSCWAETEQTMKQHHIDNGLSCSDCHTTQSPEPVAMNQCLTCHELPEPKTDFTGEPDKHDSPHYGPELDCDNCHHEHEVSENFCASCHEFEFVVP